MIDKTKVVTGVVKLSYVNVWQPKCVNGVEKYSVSIIVDKKDQNTLGNIGVAVNAAIEEGVKKFPDCVTDKSLLKLPLRDGDEMMEDVYKDKYFINASSIIQPQIVDRKLKFILNHDEVYSGVLARVSIRLFPFHKGGSMGVGCGLLNIQKVADGDRLIGIRSTPQDDFTILDEDFEDDFLD